MAYAAAYGTNETLSLTPRLKWAIANWVEALSPRRREVLELISDALTNQAIGKRLRIDVQTVERHVHDVYRRMPVEPQHQPRVFAALAWTAFRGLRADGARSGAGTDGGAANGVQSPDAA